MSKEREALKMALECVEAWDRGCDRDPYWRDIEAAVTAIKEALAEQHAAEPVAVQMFRTPGCSDWYDGVPDQHELGQHEVRTLYTSPQPAQQALDKMAENARELGLDYEPAQQEPQQPAQQGCMRCNTPKKCALYGCLPLTWPAEQREQQKPVAWMVDVDLANYQGQSEYRTILAWNAKPVHSGTHEINEVLKAVPLYTAPQPAQPSKPLTDEEIEQCMKQAYATVQGRNLEHAFARAIEAKLREKNQ